MSPMVIARTGAVAGVFTGGSLLYGSTGSQRRAPGQLSRRVS
jgi:hypothetical protein